MDAEDPARIPAGRPRLAPEAGRKARVTQGKIVRGQDLVGVQGGEADLRGADQEEVVARHLVDLRAVGRQEARPEHRLLADEHRRDHRLEAVSGELPQRILHERQLEEGEVALQVGESRAGRLRRGLHVDQPQGRPDVEVVARLEVEARRVADHADDDPRPPR